MHVIFISAILFTSITANAAPCVKSFSPIFIKPKCSFDANEISVICMFSTSSNPYNVSFSYVKAKLDFGATKTNAVTSWSNAKKIYKM